MAYYSTSLEVIVNNLCEDRYAPLPQRIESARGKIFDFDYPYPSNIAGKEFKKYFETAFINEYLFDEIAQETVGKFKQRLYTKTLEVMPKYKVIFDSLNKISNNLFNNYDYQEVADDKANEKSNSKAKGTSGGKSAGSNLPENMLAKGEIGNFDNVQYANSANISAAETNSNSDYTSDKTNHNVIQRKGRTVSFIDELLKIDGNFFNQFEQLLKEYKMLFSVLKF